MLINVNLYLTFISFGLTMADHYRSKRFLLAPPTSPTRMQLIAGIGVPIELEYESVTFGWVGKVEYFLYDNVSVVMHYLQDPWSPLTHPIAWRKRREALFGASGYEHHISNDPIDNPTHNTENNNADHSTFDEHYEKYDVEAIEIDTGLTGNDIDEDDVEYNDFVKEDDDEIVSTVTDYQKPKDFSTFRWFLFKNFEGLLERKGLPGRPCMLRSICEAAYAPFTVHSGILGELMHLIITPSTTKDTISDHSQNEYLRAEELGKAREPCDKIFRECTTSILDQFSGIYKTMENLIKMFG